jgi:hypothetical protein
VAVQPPWPVTRAADWFLGKDTAVQLPSLCSSLQEVEAQLGGGLMTCVQLDAARPRLSAVYHAWHPSELVLLPCCNHHSFSVISPGGGGGAHLLRGLLRWGQAGGHEGHGRCLELLVAAPGHKALACHQPLHQRLRGHVHPIPKPTHIPNMCITAGTQEVPEGEDTQRQLYSSGCQVSPVGVGSSACLYLRLLLLVLLLAALGCKRGTDAHNKAPSPLRAPPHGLAPDSSIN